MRDTRPWPTLHLRWAANNDDTGRSVRFLGCRRVGVLENLAIVENQKMGTSTPADVHGPTPSDLSASTVSELWQRLGSSPAGLSAKEVQRRLTQNGYNELAEEVVNPLLKFLSYFWGPIPWMIEIAAILSAIVRHWADFWIILTLLVVNAIVGFWEEYQAGNAIAALKKKLALRAKVKRGGTWSTVAAASWCRGT